MAYVPLALLFRTVPRPWRVPYLWAGSLLLALLLLGPGYVLTLGGLVLISLAVVRVCGRPRRVAAGWAILGCLYLGLLLNPTVPWLPPTRTEALREPIWFYLHWAGLAYLFLRSVHVLVDVARSLMPQPAAGELVAYLLFHPTLRMGPIWRFGDFQAQLHGRLEAVRSTRAGAGRMLIGLVRLALLAVVLKQIRLDRLFGDGDQLARLSTGRMIMGVYLAPMTLYLWISGYTDLAVGTGRMMGFLVPENFHHPWGAANIAEFWRRWHITLSLWLRDYVYIPLGGNRTHVNLNYVLTFLFCGLWHGTRPGMILWGLSQGVGLVLRRQWSGFWNRQAEQATVLHARARRMRLIESRFSQMLAWLLTFHYQVLTFCLLIDEEHACRPLLRRIAGLIGIGT